MYLLTWARKSDGSCSSGVSNLTGSIAGVDTSAVQIIEGCKAIDKKHVRGSIGELEQKVAVWRKE